MSPENNDGIEGQVRKFLSGLGGEAGEFLNQSGKTGALLSGNLGTLIGIWLDVKCGPNCQITHSFGLSLENFLSLFGQGDDPVFFNNFKFSEMGNKTELASLLDRCHTSEKETGEIKELLAKAKSFAEKVEINYSHLQVENNCLRREISRLQAAQGEMTGTALDYQPPAARQWNIWTVFKGFRLIGREGK